MALGRSNYAKWAYLFTVLFLIFSAKQALCGTIVTSFPGFDGELPFYLETGYLTVGNSEMFYYLIESEGNPREDPLIVWWSGGPGCSAFNGLIYEVGPLAFNITHYEGGVPKTYYYPYGWTQSASILFVDAPVGTGFSYATDASDYITSDLKSAWQIAGFIRLWLEENPRFLLNQLFIGADSYAGVSASIVVDLLIDDNESGRIPRLNLKGYMLGCPKIDSVITENAKIYYSNQLGLISDELFKAAYTSCNGSFYEVDIGQAECYEDLQLIKRNIKDINRLNILEPKCTWAGPELDLNGVSERRSLEEELEEENPKKFILSPPRIPEFYCHNFNYALSYVWANDKGVRSSLNIRPDTVYDWKRCNKSLAYTYDVTSVLDYHRNLSTKGLQVLVYNGDHDLVIPNIATERWIKALNLTIVNDWRPWVVDGQIAGYTIKYSDNGYRLTYATVKGAGHSPQEYKRRECFELYNRFIHYYEV